MAPALGYDPVSYTHLDVYKRQTMCMTCYDRCPLRGEGMVLDMGYVPAVGESCVGCGMRCV